MSINRIPLRTMRRNFFQFVSIIMLVAIASMTYTLFALSIEEIDKNYVKYKNEYVQEDGYFITSRQIDEKLLKNKFGIDIEQRLYFETQQGDITLRVFSITDNINKIYVGEGRIPSEGEVLTDSAFFQAQQYKIDDEINIHGKNFKISGTGYLPDYIYVIKNDQDLLPSPEHFGVVMMLKSDMQKLFSAFPVHYYIYKGELDNIDDFKSFINLNSGLLKFVERGQNPRIIYTEMKVENAKNMTLPLSLFIIIVSSLILFIIMRRVINTMHTEIGTLYSMGYKKSDVFKVFMRFPFYIWLFGSIAGILSGYFAAQPFAEFYRSFFSLPKLANIFPWQHLLVAVFMPAVFIFLSAYFALKKFFKLTIIQMLHGVDEIKFGKLPAIKIFDKFKFRTRIMLKYGWRHIARELILIIGILFSTILMMYGMTAKDSVLSGIEKAYNENFRYNYIYVLNSISPHAEIELGNYAEPYNLLTFDIKDSKAGIMIYGIKNNSDMIKLYDEKGNEISVSDKLVITKPFANKLGVKEGDDIKIKNKFTGQEYVLKIHKVANLPVGNNGYMELQSFNKMFGYNQNEYVGIFSQQKIDISERLLFESHTKSEILSTWKSSAQDISKTIGVMAFISAILALLIVNVLSSLTLNENIKNIGILKMLGYKENDIFKMVLGFNYVSFMIGFISGIPLSRYVMDSLMNSATKDIDFAMSLDLSFKSIISTFIILIAVFLFSRFSVRIKIAKVMPVDILRQQMD